MMSDAATYSFSAAPSQVSSWRRWLDFELRAADLSLGASAAPSPEMLAPLAFG